MFARNTNLALVGKRLTLRTEESLLRMIVLLLWVEEIEARGSFDESLHPDHSLALDLLFTVVAVKARLW